jgi:hypothetical protein
METSLLLVLVIITTTFLFLFVMGAFTSSAQTPPVVPVSGPRIIKATLNGSEIPNFNDKSTVSLNNSTDRLVIQHAGLKADTRIFFNSTQNLTQGLGIGTKPTDTPVDQNGNISPFKIQLFSSDGVTIPENLELTIVFAPPDGTSNTADITDYKII